MYHKVEYGTKAERDQAASEKDALVVWTGYSVSAEGYRWYVHWID